MKPTMAMAACSSGMIFFMGVSDHTSQIQVRLTITQNTCRLKAKLSNNSRQSNNKCRDAFNIRSLVGRANPIRPMKACDNSKPHLPTSGTFESSKCMLRPIAASISRKTANSRLRYRFPTAFSRNQMQPASTFTQLSETLGPFQPLFVKRMKTTLGLCTSAPTTRSFIFADLYRTSAGLAPDAGKSLVVKRIIRNVVVQNRCPNVTLG